MDQNLWQQLARADRQAFASVFRYFYGKLFNYGRKFTELDLLVEDALQETFVIVWDNHTRFSNITNPDSYLFYTFRNTLFRKLKKELKSRQREALHFTEPEFSAEYMLIKAEMDATLSMELEAAIRSLPTRQREAIYLRFYEGLEYEQIAAIMGISVKASYKTVSKGIVHLRDKFNLSVSLLFLLLSADRL